MLSRSIIVILISFFGFIATPGSQAAGWSWAFPPNYVNPVSTKRNHVFYVGEQVRFTAGAAATRFEVRDYYGTLVEAAAIQGPGATRTFDVHATKAGWYKLYLFGETDQGSPWGFAVGGTTFVIFRNDPNFPTLPAIGTPGGSDGDEIMRGVTGMGPQRLKVEDASKPTEAIQKLEADIAIDKAMYLQRDPLRKRALLVAFPNGTSNTAGVRQIVEHFKNDVMYWEGANEPDQNSTGTYAAYFQQRPFYQLVKSVDPNLKVLGPGVTSLAKQAWLNDYLKWGKGFFDVFSFHAYNCVNGDPWLARQALTDLQTLLNQYQLGGIEKWQTEQGYMAAVYGSYQPRLQGRWTMVQMMTYEQFGIPKEHNHLWYDTSHGFWDVPTWWENEDGGLNPAASLMRVWSEELYGTTFSRAYDFGAPAQNLYLGNLFTGPGKAVAAFMSGGNPVGSVQLAIAGGSTIHVVSPFGVESDMAVTNGVVRLPVSELPTYVHLAPGQTCEVVPPALGENLTLQAGVTIEASGSPTHPADSSIPNSTAKLINGKLENWYYSQNNVDQPWMSNVTAFPATIEITLPQPASISDVILYAGVPWQNMGTLVDYELQYWNGSQWVQIEHVVEPTKTWKVYTPAVRCTVDSFFSDRWIFEHHFPAITTAKLRLVVNEVTYGGGATQDVVSAGGQTGLHQVVLREIEVRRTPTLAAPQILQPPASQTVPQGTNVHLSVTASGGNPQAYIWTKDGHPVSNGSGAGLDLPNVNFDAQGSYSVTVVNAVGAATSSPAIIRLDTAQTPFGTWAGQHFTASGLNDLRVLMQGDDDGDGLNNLTEYFLNLNPVLSSQLSDRSRLPKVYTEKVNGIDDVVFQFEANPLAGDVSIAVEGSATLAAGSWVSAQPDSIDTPFSNPATGNTVFRFRFHASTTSVRYFRLKLTIL